MDLYNLINLTKTTSCFKGKRSCIDLLLKNQKYPIFLVLLYPLRLVELLATMVTRLISEGTFSGLMRHPSLKC